jgi:hypothetical protein
MRRWACLVVAFACAPPGAGCLARQFACDGAGAQKAVADVYTDQAMTNLIRARNNLPFVQLKFSAINVTDTDDYNASASVRQTINTVRDLLAATGTRTLTNEYDLTGTCDRRRVMSLNADPVTDQNDVYELYLAFACDPNLLVCADEPPGHPVHVLRKCGKKYYWIPCEAARAFLDLVLRTALMRGPEAVPPAPAAYEVRIVQVLNVAPVGGGRDATNATLVFDKPVPNGEATMVVDLDDGRRVRASLWPVGKDADGKAVPLGQPTTRLDIQWSPKRDGFTENNLLGRPARLYSRDFPPEVVAPSPVVRKIAADVNQIKVNQFSGIR